MKIFDKDRKINFIDDNNCFLGYDMSQCCCENADWFIADSPKNSIENREYYDKHYEDLNLEDYSFDTSFFKNVSGKEFDEGGMAIFRIISNIPDRNEKFIHIFNAHNGYYGHGFEFKIGETVKENGRL